MPDFLGVIVPIKTISVYLCSVRTRQYATHLFKLIYCTMNIEKLTKVLQTKAASFGYNKRELRGIAEAISNNSTLTDDATDEEYNAEVEAVLPYLKFGQQQASRIAQSLRPDPDGGNGTEKRPVPPSQKDHPEDEEPAWAKALREQNEQLMQRLNIVEGERLAKTRHERLQTLLGDCGTFGEATLKSFGRMTFATEEDFEEYAAEVAASVEAYKAERGGDALKSLTAKPGGGGAKNPAETPTEEEISFAFGR